MKTITMQQALAKARKSLEDYSFDFSGDALEKLSAIKFALYRMDDKPLQCWARLYHFAKSCGDEDAMDSCALMFWMGETPESIFTSLTDTVKE